MQKSIKLLALLLLLPLLATAQVAVTVGSQVTSVSNIVSGKAYLLRWQGLTGTPFALDTGGTSYGMANNNSASLAAVYYLIDNGDGTWKVENAYTGRYWPTPQTNEEAIAPTDAANAGSYTIAASATSGRFTFTANNYHTNRSSSKLVMHTNDSPVSIFEVSAGTLSTSANYSEFTGKDISISSTASASISEGQWYVMSQRSRTTYVFENTSDHKLKHTRTKPSGLATDKANYLVRLLSANDGKYYLQNGLGNYMGVVAQSTNVPTTAVGTEAVTVAKISNTDGHFYLQGTTNSSILDANDFAAGDPSTVVGWGTSAPTSTGGNNDWAFYPVELVEAWNPTVNDVYTINNTNTSRGALIYNPSASTKYVWSSGKSGTFNASDANSQWVIIPTGTSSQYYLYNVGAGKFAIPTAIAQGSGNAWVFSENAVPVCFEEQGDGTKKIKMATDPVSGTNAAYMAVSNSYTGPIINYNDVGGNFTITKVDGQDQSTAANAAVAKLVKSQTALSTYPNATGWYAIQIKRSNNNSKHVGRYLYTAESLHNDLYPLTFTGAVDIQPSITDPTYFTHIEYTTWNSNKWQLPDGRYLVSNSNNKFPVASTTSGNVISGYDSGNYFKSESNYYADAYNSNANYFIGETTSFRTEFNVYPIDLNAAGLVAWQVLCDVAPDNAQITCSRSDVKGLTTVYKNGYFFLPNGVTPVAGDFLLNGASDVAIDASAHTITFTYNTNLAIVDGGVTVEQGWQTAGRDSEVMLLKITASPFKAATNASFNISLKDGAEANVSKLTLYEASSNSPEILSAGNTGAPTKTSIATANVSGSSATLTIGNLSAGTHYYWLAAEVKSNATLGAIVDAAVTGLTYTCNNVETTLDVTSVGDPADRGAMVFNAHSYPFLPRDNGSRVYRIPAMIVADDGSIVVAADKRYDSHTDIGNGHVIDIIVRRSTDGGKTWSSPITIAKGLGSADNAKCGYGDPSLVKGKDGKLYCLFVAGNLGYFYGQQRIAMSTSTDNGVTWSSNETIAPIDLLESGRLKNYNTVGEAGYGLYDYFVTSGRGLYIPEDDILMYLIPAQTMTSSTAHTSNSQDYIFYSRDGGESWYFSSQIMFAGGDEAKIIQMNDGSLLGSVRQAYNRGFNTATYTKNADGKTLDFTMGTQWNHSQLSAGGSPNNQDLIYYQRGPKSGKTDVIIHSMTTGQHANLKLYYSLDQGANWTEFLNVQTKGTRYVTLERSGTDENPGSLYMLFEDQSLNSAGGYTDYNHYPLNFLEITREQLEALIPTLNDLIPINTAEGVKVVYGTTAHTTYGTLSGLTWTSKVTSGVSTGDNTVAGLTMEASDGAFNQFSNWNSHYNIAYHPANANTDATLTLTAPAGYAIDSYSMLVARASSAAHTYTVTNAAGTSIDVPFGSSASSYATVSQSGINAASTAITVNTSDASMWLAIADFTVNLRKAVTYQIVDDLGNLGANQLVIFETNSVEDEMPDALKTAGYTYTFYSDAECTTPVSEINDLTTVYVRMTGVYKNVQVSYVADGFFTTIYSPVALVIPSSARAFAGVISGDMLVLKQYDGIIPAMQGAVIEFMENPVTGELASFTYDFTPATSDGTPIADNRLTGSLVDVAPSTFSEKVYTFAVKSGNLGFYKYTGSMLKAGKAFLLLNDNEANNIRGFVLDFPTGINTLPAADGTSQAYDLQGRRVNKASKGLYIINGKKVIK